MGEYGVASDTFSPNLSNPPFFVDLPLDQWANYVPEVWALWMEHNLPQFLQNLSGNPGSNGTRIYFDAGTQDQFYILPACNAFADSLDALGIDYEYQIFEGGHFDKLHERFTIAVSFLCEKMQNSHPGCDVSEEFAAVPQAERTFGYHSAAYDRASFETRIAFDLQIPGFVSLDIYDGMGRVVETLVNSHLDPGMHNVGFNGSILAPGVYFYNIRSSETSVTGKVLLLN